MSFASERDECLAHVARLVRTCDRLIDSVYGHAALSWLVECAVDALDAIGLHTRGMAFHYDGYLTNRSWAGHLRGRIAQHTQELRLCLDELPPCTVNDDDPPVPEFDVEALRSYIRLLVTDLAHLVNIMATTLTRQGRLVDDLVSSLQRPNLMEDVEATVGEAVKDAE